MLVSAARFNLLFAIGPSVAKAVLGLAVLGPLAAHCAAAPSPERRGGGNDDSDDIFKMMAGKAQEAMDSFTPDSALDVNPKHIYDVVSKRANDLITQGAPGQVGFGFMMGFSSGFFLKKVYIYSDIVPLNI
jgi:hypothetical protein